MYSVVHPFDFPVEKIRELAPKAIMLSGGPQSVYSEAAPYCSREVFDLGIPILGICYGMQLTAFLLDGKVEAAAEREYGRAEIDVTAESPLFTGHAAASAGVGQPRRPHPRAPPGFRITASSPNAPIAAFENRERGCYCIQFHPEVTHTEAGAQIIRNFLFDIAGLRADVGPRRLTADARWKRSGSRSAIAEPSPR